MKKNSKIFMALAVVAVTVISAFTLVGCSGIGETVAMELTGAETEAFAFAVNKDNDTMLKALNEFVMLDSTVAAFETSVKYHDKTMVDPKDETAVSIEYPDLSQYEGNGSIIMLTEASFPPYEYINNTLPGSVGGVAGVDVDMMILFAASQEKTLEVEDGSFDNIIILLQADEVGNKIGAAGMSVTPDRAEKLAFSKPYTESIQYIISEKTNSYTSFEDLKGLVVGVQKGTTGHLMMEAALKDGGVLFGTGAEVRPFASTNDAYEDLENGRLNAIMLDEKPALALVKMRN